MLGKAGGIVDVLAGNRVKTLNIRHAVRVAPLESRTGINAISRPSDRVTRSQLSKSSGLCDATIEATISQIASRPKRVEHVSAILVK